MHPYFDFRDELTVQDSLVCKGPAVVVPMALRREMMEVCHETHIGVEGCKQRARESMFWPRMSTDLKTYIFKCDMCMAHRIAQQKEMLQQHDFIPRPWSKVGADLCELDGYTLLMVCDYFCNFIEVECLRTTTTQAVCKPLMTLLSRYGMPDTLVSDNSRQFSSAEFSKITRSWSYENHHHYTTHSLMGRQRMKCREIG